MMKASTYEQIDEIQGDFETVVILNDKEPQAHEDLDDAKLSDTKSYSRFIWSLPLVLFGALLFFLYNDLPALNTEPSLKTPDAEYRAQNFNPPIELSASDGILEIEMRVGVCRNNISDIVFFTSRCFNGNIPGPTLIVSRGDRVRIHLINELGAEGMTSDDLTPINSFRHPNITSFHLHGLHVSPEEENLYKSCGPGETVTYDIEIPLDHDSGTFYYHPHYHGSSALQMMGGMSGAIIVRDGNRTVDDTDDRMSIPERVNERMKDDVAIVLQRLHFSQGDTSGVNYFDIAGLSGDRIDPELSISRSQPTISGNEKDNLMVNSLMVNGQLNPFVYITNGQPTTFRIVHAGVDSVVALRIRRNILLDQSGTSCPCTFIVSARDGVSAASTSNPRVLSMHDTDAPLLIAPGSRADINITCSCTGGRKYVRDRPEPMSIFELYSSAGRGDIVSDVVNYVGTNTPIMESTLMQVGVTALVEIDSGFVPFDIDSEDGHQHNSHPKEVSTESEYMKKSNDRIGKYARRNDGTIINSQSTRQSTHLDLRDVSVPNEFIMENMHGCMDMGVDHNLYMHHAINGRMFNASHIQKKVELGSIQQWKIVSMGRSACGGEEEGGEVMMEPMQPMQKGNNRVDTNDLGAEGVRAFPFEFLGAGKSGLSTISTTRRNIRGGAISASTLNDDVASTSSGGYSGPIRSSDSDRRQLMMDMDDESHPFHMHINHFQIVESTSTCNFDYDIGDWRDTITLPSKGNVTIRWRAEDYTGKTVAHCHVLSHADTGMVLNFEIVDESTD